jgi:Fe(3+) dicitrate transport protein
MTFKAYLKLTVLATAASLAATPLHAQEAAEPADGSLPEVQVIQKKASPAPAAKKKAAPVQAASPAPQPPPQDYVTDTEPSSDPGRRGVDGRVTSNAPNSNPVNPASGVLPADLQNYTGAGTRVSTDEINEQRPKDNLELLSRVPGVTVVYDDGLGRHVGIGLRGSPNRRARKVLVMEDGMPINFSTILDPSTHYTPPTDRVESVEVLRGTVIVHGPLNNHGVINFRNLNPFGPSETVISGAIGNTEGSDKDVNNKRHVHTRQNLGNAGVVASYSGGDAGGSWDNEELGYNDFYGALGFRGSDQDLVVSGGYFRQRDTYDENNFIGTEAQFYANGRSKGSSPFFLGDNNLTDLNSYNADFYRIQAAHNWYIDEDTTLSTRAYYSNNERNRFAGRRYSETTVGDIENGYMRGRERTYEFYGIDSRVEFADRPFIAGMTQDIQAGVRYEQHSFRNCNSVGLKNQVLDDDTGGNCFVTNAVGSGAYNAGAPLTPGLYRENSRFTDTDGDIFSAFIQTAIHVTNNLTVTPGIRFDSIDITQNNILNPEAPALPGIHKSNHDHVLPGISFAWEALPRTTLYGGFHQGVTPQVTRGPALPLPDEEGDNYQVGVRSTGLRGLTLDLAYFHGNIDNYQVKSPTTDAFQNSVYGVVDEVEINGFELYSRLDSRPFTGGPWNFFGEAVYTFSDSEITKSQNPAEVGNAVPEVPRHFASLTLGMEHKSGFDVSVTGTYRGEFFTDTFGTTAWTCLDEDGNAVPSCSPADDAEGVVGKIDGQWLLSARANYLVPNTNLTLFVSGQNLTDEFYVSDFSDGAKPGVGRTFWAGFTYRFD